MKDQKEIDDGLVQEQAELGTASERSLRWLADGATTLSEVVQRIRDYADYLVQLELGGWQLFGEVDNLYLFMQNPKYPIGTPDDEDDW